MGRRKRTEAVAKTTVYYPEADLNLLDPKNRKRALKIAKEISLKAVSDAATVPAFSASENSLGTEEQEINLKTEQDDK